LFVSWSFRVLRFAFSTAFSRLHDYDNPQTRNAERETRNAKRETPQAHGALGPTFAVVSGRTVIAAVEIVEPGLDPQITRMIQMKNQKTVVEQRTVHPLFLRNPRNLRMGLTAQDVTRTDLCETPAT
jgi:hypothetical protein